jgi:CO dehydrogenase maturation factor
MTPTAAAHSSVTAVVGKGGVGKTVVTALLARELLERRAGRLLLVDADPAEGLTLALGVEGWHTVGEIRERLIADARAAGRDATVSWAEVMAYRLLEALHEQPGWSLVTMGRSEARGCFCSVNSLVRDAIDGLAHSFDHLIVDAEAGVEQVQRHVTRAVTRAIVVCDASQRSLHTARLLRGLFGAQPTAHERGSPATAPALCAVLNRAPGPSASARRALEGLGLPILAELPRNDELARFDERGRRLLDLPSASPVVEAVRPLADWLLEPARLVGDESPAPGGAS